MADDEKGLSGLPEISVDCPHPEYWRWCNACVSALRTQSVTVSGEDEMIERMEQIQPCAMHVGKRAVDHQHHCYRCASNVAAEVLKWIRSGMRVRTLQSECYANAKARGFHQGEPDIWKFIGNLHGECSEAWEEARKPDFDPKRTYYRNDGKPEGLPSELADIIIRVCDTAESFGIDLEAAIREKMAYNATRSYRHGNKRA